MTSKFQVVIQVAVDAANEVDAKRALADVVSKRVCLEGEGTVWGTPWSLHEVGDPKIVAIRGPRTKKE